MHPCTCKTECGCLDKVPVAPKCGNSAVPKVRRLLDIWPVAVAQLVPRAANLFFRQRIRKQQKRPGIVQFLRLFDNAKMAFPLGLLYSIGRLKSVQSKT